MRRRDVLLGAGAAAGCASMSVDVRRPIVIAHRGASAYRPEHTMAAYSLAIQQGADFIEPDLVMTRDGVLVCRHENEISETTDVAVRPQFSDRRKHKNLDGQTVAGWWAEDFTLAELKTLRCKERLPQLRPQNVAYDGSDVIPTFAEVLALAADAGVGVYPELKHPSFLREQGLNPVEALVAAVREAGGQPVADRLYVQCFETWPLRQLAEMSSLLWRCVQLISASSAPWDRRDLAPASLTSEAGLREISIYAMGIGAEKTLIIPRDDAGASLAPTDLIAHAHSRGLVVHAWTFRPENHFLPLELRRGDESASDFPRQHGDALSELRQFYAAGVDGVFADAPDAAVAARA